MCIVTRPSGKDEPMCSRVLSPLVGCTVLCDCILGKEILRCRCADAGYGSKDAKLGALGIHWMVLFRRTKSFTEGLLSVVAHTATGQEASDHVRENGALTTTKRVLEQMWCVLIWYHQGSFFSELSV